MKHGLVLFQKLLYHYSILRISFCTYILDELFFPIHKEPQLIFESTINFWNVVFFFWSALFEWHIQADPIP